MDETNRIWSSSDDDDRPPAGPWVDVVDAVGCMSCAELDWVREQARRAIEELGCAGEVRVRVIDDAAMSAAHERYAGVSGTTDVLTFDLSGCGGGCGGVQGGGVLDADILVCVDEARRQAGRLGHEPRRELLLYIVHGVLHCMGHDDHDDASYGRMHAREDEVLERIGVGVTFGREPSGDRDRAGDMP